MLQLFLILFWLVAIVLLAITNPIPVALFIGIVTLDARVKFDIDKNGLW